jgi:hypothetical protein
MEQEKRHRDRYRVQVRASLRNGDAEAHAVVVTSLSADGCGFASACEMPVGAPVSMAMGRIGALSARVQWREGECHGLAFEQPLSHVVLDHIRLFLSDPPALVAERVEGTIAA